MLRNVVDACQVVPASALDQLARTLATVAAGTVASPTLCHIILLEDDITSAYTIPRDPEVSNKSDDRGIKE